MNNRPERYSPYGSGREMNDRRHGNAFPSYYGRPPPYNDSLPTNGGRNHANEQCKRELGYSANHTDVPPGVTSSNADKQGSHYNDKHHNYCKNNERSQDVVYKQGQDTSIERERSAEVSSDRPIKSEKKISDAKSKMHDVAQLTLKQVEATLRNEHEAKRDYVSDPDWSESDDFPMNADREFDNEFEMVRKFILALPSCDNM